VLFVDVRGFTSLAERLPPAEIARRLNRFYALASRAIFDHDGTLDKLVGDEVMAFFGAPLYAEDHPARAVRAAIGILQAVNDLAQGEGLHVGAGIATGEAFVGNVGEGTVADYTVLGDTVIVAARLQGAHAAGEILVNEETYAGVAAMFPDLPRREIELKGKSGPVGARAIVVNGVSAGTNSGS
jgi:adenylate cyclase